MDLESELPNPFTDMVDLFLCRVQPHRDNHSGKPL
jgi:hypothetical protein